VRAASPPMLTVVNTPSAAWRPKPSLTSDTQTTYSMLPFVNMTEDALSTFRPRRPPASPQHRRTRRPGMLETGNLDSEVSDGGHDNARSLPLHRGKRAHGKLVLAASFPPRGAGEDCDGVNDYVNDGVRSRGVSRSTSSPTIQRSSSRGASLAPDLAERGPMIRIVLVVVVLVVDLLRAKTGLPFGMDSGRRSQLAVLRAVAHQRDGSTTTTRTTTRTSEKGTPRSGARLPAAESGPGSWGGCSLMRHVVSERQPISPEGMVAASRRLQPPDHRQPPAQSRRDGTVTRWLQPPQGQEGPPCPARRWSTTSSSRRADADG